MNYQSNLNKIQFKSALEYQLALEYSQNILNARGLPYPLLDLFGSKTKEELCNQLNWQLEQNIDLKNEIVNGMKSYIDSMIIREDDIPWFDKNNSRMCFFIWYNCIKTNHTPNRYPAENQFSMQFNLDGIFSTTYLEHMIENINPTSKTCFEESIAFISLTNTSKQTKIYYLNYLHDTFLTLDSIENFSWLEKKIDRDWAIKYILNKLNAKNVKFHFPKSHSEDDVEHATILAFYVVDDFPIWEKVKLINDLKKAWNQQKHRNKLNEKNKKNYNYIMHENIGDKINFIKSQWEERANSGNSEPWNKRIFNKNEILEMLIDAEFERFKNIPPEEIK